jgi:hypothetical protein
MRLNKKMKSQKKKHEITIKKIRIKFEDKK